MPTRPDLRQIASNVRDALADSDRHTLLELLTFVLKEYVVDGPPPMLMHQAETVADLAGLSFAQLVIALQTRLEHPELGLFAVDGERVSVRVGGVMQPLDSSRNAPLAAELPRPAAGVRVVETNLAPRPPAAITPAPPVAAAPAAPRPTQGVSLRGRPGGGGGAMLPTNEAPAPAPAPAAPAPAPTASGAGAAPTPTTKEPDGDDASARFSLLELD